MSILDKIGIEVSLSDIPAYHVLCILRESPWYKERNTFFRKYIYPWLLFSDHRFMKRLYQQAITDTQAGLMGAVIEKAEKKINA